MSSIAALLVLFPSLGLTASFANAVRKGDVPQMYLDHARVLVGISSVVSAYAFMTAFPMAQA